jgi:hypothetical protein
MLTLTTLELTAIAVRSLDEATVGFSTVCAVRFRTKVVQSREVSVCCI